MGKGLPRSHSRGQFTRQELIKQLIVVEDLLITVDGASGVGFGSVVMGDFPKGNLLFLGAVSYMQFTGPGSVDLEEDWTGDFSIGTTPTADATPASNDVNLIQLTTIAPASAEVSPRTRAIHVQTSETGTIHDNTDNSLEMNLNVIIDDADINADGIVLTVNGVIELLYSVLLDDDV
ncbi:MAG: hypothetical protein V3S98_09465 [Dehalococcoidia bacterium]